MSERAELKQAVLEMAGELRTMAVALDELAKRIDALPEEEEAPAPAAVAQQPKLMLEDVRKVLARKAGEGFKEEVRNLILDLGANKLSDVPPGAYAGLVEKAEALSHGS